MAGLFSFLDKSMDKLPIQGRIERWKNEIDNLEQEKRTILISKADIKKAGRLGVINNRLSKLYRLCKNKID